MARKPERTADNEREPRDGRQTPTRPRDDRDGGFTRRSYLSLGGAVVTGLGSAVGAAGHPATVERGGIEFGDVRHAVDDLGMDPTGSAPIDGILAGTNDGELLQFPDGLYRFDPEGEGVELDGGTRGFEAVGESVAFAAPEGCGGYLLSAEGTDGLYLDGIDVDQTAAGTVAGLRLCGDRVVVKNVELRGECDLREGGVPAIAHATPSADGAGLVENVVATAGTAVRPVLGRPGVFVEESHAGTLTVRGCDLREFPDAAVHAAGHAGTVSVRESYFENNAAAVRLCGSDSAVEGCEVVVDGEPVPHDGTLHGRAGRDQPFRFHGIAVGEGTARGADRAVRVADTTIRVEDGPVAGPAIVSSSSGPPLEVVDCTIEYDSDGPAVILCRSPGQSIRSTVRPLRLCGTSITGDGNVDTAVLVSGAAGCDIGGSSISLPDAGDGIRIRRSDSCRIAGTTISGVRRMAVFRDADVECSGLTRHGEPTAAGVSTDPAPRNANEPGNHLVVGGAGRTEYSFAVDPRTAKQPFGGDGEPRVSGTVTDGRKEYRFDGTVAVLTVRGRAALS